jgi:hypothetical protein
LLSGERKPKYRADTEFALHRHHPVVGFDESLDDGKAALFRDALAIVADETLHGAPLARQARAYDELPARVVCGVSSRSRARSVSSTRAESTQTYARIIDLDLAYRGVPITLAARGIPHDTFT